MDMTVIASNWVIFCYIALFALMGLLTVMGAIYGPAIVEKLPVIIDELQEVKKQLQVICAKLDATEAYYTHYEKQVQPLVDLLNRVDNPGTFYDVTQSVLVGDLPDIKLCFHNPDNEITEKSAAITKKLEDQ